MTAEPLVDVRYRGLLLATGVPLRDVRRASAFVAVDEPMPVGTPVDVAIDGGVTCTARVVHVREKTDSAPHAGMWIAVGDDAPDEVRAWWAEHANGDDEAAADAPAEPAAADAPAAQEGDAPNEPAADAAAEPAAADAPDAEAAPDAGAVAVPQAAVDSGGARTQIMSAVDLAQIEALASGEPSGEFERRAAEAAAAGVTGADPPEAADAAPQPDPAPAEVAAAETAPASKRARGRKQRTTGNGDGGESTKKRRRGRRKGKRKS